MYQDLPGGIYAVNLLNNSILNILIVIKHNGDNGGVKFEFTMNEVAFEKCI